MGNLFGHESLRVYKAAVEFAVLGDALLKRIHRKAAARDHLSRAMDGIPLQIARANSSWSAKERVTCLGHANGSVLECAACLDILAAKQLLSKEEALSGKQLLRQTCSMLIAMQKSASDRVGESNTEEYTTRQGVLFSHERLDVYQVAIQFASWVDALIRDFSGRQDLADRLDKSSTGIALNIAEGNGRFTRADHMRFLRIAHGATVQSAAILDLAVARQAVDDIHLDDGKGMLERIGAMLTAMATGLKDS